MVATLHFSMLCCCLVSDVAGDDASACSAAQEVERPVEKTSSDDRTMGRRKPPMLGDNIALTVDSTTEISSDNRGGDDGDCLDDIWPMPLPFEDSTT